MNRRRIFFFICYSILAIILYSAIKTTIEGEKGKVKRLIFSARRAVEKEDLVRLSGYIALTYQDRYGFNRETLLLAGQTVFKEYQNITLQIEDLKIELNKPLALAQLKVRGWAMRSSGKADNAPLEYDEVDLKVELNKEEQNWKVIEFEFSQPEQITFIKNML